MGRQNFIDRRRQQVISVFSINIKAQTLRFLISVCAVLHFNYKNKAEFPAKAQPLFSRLIGDSAGLGHDRDHEDKLSRDGDRSSLPEGDSTSSRTESESADTRPTQFAAKPVLRPFARLQPSRLPLLIRIETPYGRKLGSICCDTYFPMGRCSAPPDCPGPSSHDLALQTYDARTASPTRQPGLQVRRYGQTHRLAPAPAHRAAASLRRSGPLPVPRGHLAACLRRSQ